MSTKAGQDQAMVQVRSASHPGRTHDERKRREGTSHREALRALERQLATVVFYRLQADARGGGAATSGRLVA